MGSIMGSILGKITSRMGSPSECVVRVRLRIRYLLDCCMFLFSLFRCIITHLSSSERARGVIYYLLCVFVLVQCISFWYGVHSVYTAGGRHAR